MEFVKGESATAKKALCDGALSTCVHDVGGAALLPSGQ